jgi:hypothetical protein
MLVMWLLILNKHYTSIKYMIDYTLTNTIWSLITGFQNGQETLKTPQLEPLTFINKSNNKSKLDNSLKYSNHLKYFIILIHWILNMINLNKYLLN